MSSFNDEQELVKTYTLSYYIQLFPWNESCIAKLSDISAYCFFLFCDGFQKLPPLVMGFINCFTSRSLCDLNISIFLFWRLASLFFLFQCISKSMNIHKQCFLLVIFFLSLSLLVSFFEIWINVALIAFNQSCFEVLHAAFHPCSYFHIALRLFESFEKESFYFVAIYYLSFSASWWGPKGQPLLLMMLLTLLSYFIWL